MKPSKPKDTARYGVQVVYFGEIDRELDATLQVITGRPGTYTGHSSTQRRDLFWPCFDRSEAANLTVRIDEGLARRCVTIALPRIAIKTEEQHWAEKIQVALGRPPQ